MFSLLSLFVMWYEFCLFNVYCVFESKRNYNNNKKIYNTHIITNHESEARAVTRWPDGVC